MPPIGSPTRRLGRAGAPIINFTVSALWFFFTVTLGRADAARHLTFVHAPRKLPVVLSPEEVVATNTIRDVMSPLDRLTPLKSGGNKPPA